MNMFFAEEKANQLVTSKKFWIFIESSWCIEFKRRRKRTIYSLRHSYATFRLEEVVSVHILAKNMGTSTKMIGEHYGHTVNRTNAEELTKHRDKGDSLPQATTKLWERIAVS